MIDMRHKNCLTVLVRNYWTEEETAVSQLHNSVSALHNEIDTLCNAFSKIQQSFRMEVETVNTLGLALRQAVKAQPSLIEVEQIKHALVLYALVTGDE